MTDVEMQALLEEIAIKRIELINAAPWSADVKSARTNEVNATTDAVDHEYRRAHLAQGSL